jgi:benzoyl-CoA-dihydrodiol lyase
MEPAMSVTHEDQTAATQAPVPGPATPDSPAAVRVSFDTEPARYRHWRMSVDGPVATLTLDVAEDGGITDGYELKMNSYDLGVDIELHDAVQRLRF